MTPLEKFQELLRELFQLKDAAELDFGIYRILNLKRVQVEEFIANRLPAIVAEAFTEYTTADMAELQKQLSKLRAEYVALAGEAAFESGGGLRADLRSSERGKEYSELHSRLKSAVATEELKTRVYNDLYSFFSRYYDDGDFITRRRIRYSGNDAYAIPYNGDEVVLHWATKDQYYVKTIDRFTNYRFRAGDYSVVFEVKRADADEGNGRDKKRYYAIAGQDPVAWDATTSTLRVYFEYRPLSGKEQTTYGRTEQQKPQDKLNDEAAQAILGAIPDAAPKADLARSDKADSEDSVLTRHLRRFTRRNSSDFFIHKNLRGFLEQELDYFIKAECVLLDEVLNAEDLKLSQAHVLRARVVRRIGGHIIDFLAQVEDFQKKLFEKRKLVQRAEYCLTLVRVPETFWPEILANEAQLAEWRELFTLDDLPKQAKKRKPAIAFLKAHPTLVIDTKYFSEDFKWRLLASFDNLDDATDGLLVKSENFQALCLLLEEYRERVRCITVDPPYNRLADSFPYKDNYRHSSWAAMMLDRTRVAAALLRQTGALFSNIDENERDNLQAVLDLVFGRENRVEELIWAQNTTHSQSPLYSTNHEYVEVYARNRPAAEQVPVMFREPKPGFGDLMALANELNPRYPSIAEVEVEIKTLFERHIAAYKAELLEQGLEYDEDTKKQDPWRGLYNYCHAEYRDGENRLVSVSEARTKLARIVVWREDNPSAPAQKQSESIRDPKDPNYRFYRPLHPSTGKPCPHPKTGWRWPYRWPVASRDSFDALDRAGRIAWGEDETKVPQYKRYVHDVETNVAKSVFHDYTDGEKQLAALFGRSGVFPSPKPTTLPARFITQSCGKSDIVVDYFAGSGTTGHAVIDLNREHGARHRFILVEMGGCFDTVLLPRIKKVTFSPEWKNGVPGRLVTAEEAERGPRVIKYIRLESYEDSLNNISVSGVQAAQTALELHDDDYLLNYMLEFETRYSPSLLNAEMFKEPFSYKLKVQDGNGARESAVDLVQTFNYLLGLDVRKLRQFEDGGRVYRAVLGDKRGKSVVVVWRSVKDIEENKDALLQDKVFIEKTILPALLADGAKPDRLFVNAASFVEGAEAIEPEFKRLMFAPIA
ncbi:MAG: site-specific DNA-methyltransferase [candidate division WOR-3 bacterium]|nr:site-specific DNA-methyltransferase [candidate division WOR-3 bacterium]